VTIKRSQIRYGVRRSKRSAGPFRRRRSPFPTWPMRWKPARPGPNSLRLLRSRP